MNVDSRGLIGSIVFHITILLLFILFGFKTPLPLPAEKGILINFGDSDLGIGTTEPKYGEEVSEPETQAPAETNENSQTKESYLTQNTEEAPSIKTSDKPKTEEKKEKKTETKPVTTTNKAETKPEEKKEIKPVVDTRAIYKGKKTDSNSNAGEGVKSGTGNQGSLTGSENATDHTLGMGGEGVSADLAGRNVLSLPKPDIDSQKEGKVVVEIRVDRSGKVVRATPGVKGSTTLDSFLLGVAKKYALASKFDNKPDAPFYQTGKITYIFRLK